MEIRRLCEVDHESTWHKMNFINVDEHNNHHQEYEINFICVRCDNKVKEFFTKGRLKELLENNTWREEHFVV